jgi:hypothetical protein
MTESIGQPLESTTKVPVKLKRFDFRYLALLCFACIPIAFVLQRVRAKPGARISAHRCGVRGGSKLEDDANGEFGAVLGDTVQPCTNHVRFKAVGQALAVGADVDSPAEFVT